MILAFQHMRQKHIQHSTSPFTTVITFIQPLRLKISNYLFHTFTDTTKASQTDPIEASMRAAHTAFICVCVRVCVMRCAVENTSED